MKEKVKVFKEERFLEIIKEKNEEELEKKWKELCLDSFQEKTEEFFKQLELCGFINIAYWSYLRERLFPLYLIKLPTEDNKKTSKISEACKKIKKEVLYKFSFIELMVENEEVKNMKFIKSVDHERIINQEDKESTLIITLKTELDNKFITSFVKKLKELKLKSYDGKDLAKYSKRMEETIKEAIIGPFKQDINYIYFIPLVSSSKIKTISGIVALNMFKPIDHLLRPIKYFFRGLIGPFFIYEIDYLRDIASLKSSIAAIMSRNMSHIDGSHIETGIRNNLDSLKELFLREINDLIFSDKGTKNKFIKKLWNIESNITAIEMLHEKSKNLDLFSQSLEQNIEIIKQLIVDKIVEECRNRYSEYHQQKMDFIARMGTHWPNWGAGLDFYINLILPLKFNTFLFQFINYYDEITIENQKIQVYYQCDKEKQLEKIEENIELFGSEIDPNSPRHLLHLAMEKGILSRKRKSFVEFKVSNRSLRSIWDKIMLM